MVNHSLERALEMKRLVRELKQHPHGSVESERRWARFDELLDKDLADSGAHAPDCRCNECLAVVEDAMARRLGEDVASVEDWGPMSVAPE